MDLKLEEYVSNILRDLRERGMSALREYSMKFDNYHSDFRVRREEFEEAERSISSRDRKIIDCILERIETHHRKQLQGDIIEIRGSSLYGVTYRPLRRIGIYVPGGKPLPSSLMMVGIPAKIAGVREMVVTTPPKSGKINAHVLYVASRLGIKEVYKIGGIQAIGAMAYGIGMKKVDKIFGPGNNFVNEAKRQVFGVVGIDRLAGASEIAIIADNSANREYVLYDLLSQLEHGKDSRAYLFTNSHLLASYCKRPGIQVCLCNNLKECAQKVNEIGPEHLEIITQEPMKLATLIENAGAIYLGEYTPVPAADYFLGVNHVLPTGGAARFSGVLTIMDFLKPITIVQVSREEFLKNRELGMRMAEIEDMKLHRKSLEVRK